MYQTRANQRNVTRWEVVVKMDDGSGRSVVQNYEPLFVVGDRVHVFGTPDRARAVTALAGALIARGHRRRRSP